MGARQRSYLPKPDAFRVSFRDERNGYEQAERIVPWPGFEGDPRVFEDLTLEGKTDPDAIWIEARRRQYELELRRDTFTCIQPGSMRPALRGDAVALSCDLLEHTQTAARVRRVTENWVVLDAPVEMKQGVEYAVKWQVYDEDDTVGDSVHAALVTVPGHSFSLLFKDGSELPEVGAEIHFGEATRVDFACRILSVETAQDMSFRLTMTNDAPELDALAAAEVPPEWVAIAGEDVVTAGTPTTPVIGTVVEEVAEYFYSATPQTDVLIPLFVPYENTVSVQSVAVSHRETGAATFDVTEIGGSSGLAVLSYPSGTSIEFYAAALSVFGDASAATETVSLTLSAAAILPTPLDLGSISAIGGLGQVTLLVSTAADTAEVQIFRVAAGDPLDVDLHQVGAPRTVTPSSGATLIDGDASRADLITAGDMSDAAAWTLSDVTISGGEASHATGTAGSMAQVLDVIEGDRLRGEIFIDTLTAGTLTLRSSGADDVVLTAPGAHLFTLAAGTTSTLEIHWSADCDAVISDVLAYRASATSAPQGAWDYYVAPITADRIATAPAGPIPARII